MNTILVIDDEAGIRGVLQDILKDEKYTVFTAADGREGLALLDKESIDLVILDVWLPNMGGMDVLKEIREKFPGIEVVMISGHSNIDLAVKAIKSGAFDFLEKPLSLERVITIVRNAFELEKLRRENLYLRNNMLQEDEIIGESDAVRQLSTLIEQSGKSDSRVLITGPNGTGKELVARDIHRKSARAGGPFVEVNCAAIPESLIESELFGHEKGAFTGAISRRKGKFELAHRGTLFLDEVADMSLSTQAKLLRVIQELKFERIGGEESLVVDVRVLAATNKNIREQIEAGRFREDLFFRLNVIPIQVPSLAERACDIPLLADYFMVKFKPPVERSPRSISPEGMSLLQSHPWPGNIRELKNFIERINIMTDEQCVSPETVKYYLGESRTEAQGPAPDEFTGMSLGDAKEAFERGLIERRLAAAGYNIAKTAEALGIYPSNLHGKMKRYGIKAEK
ncbi:MAG: sigma-54 dependent transcriptional regulator [Spirochaetales bacterium]|jgi:two-component system nitrogen regulation response regulator NtrX|nr:sigma-54 dependent transcriptional regulator [Spirochaetales bacterium]